MRYKLGQVVAAFSIAVLAATQVSAAILDGQTVTVYSDFYWPHGGHGVTFDQDFIVGPGVEVTDLRGVDIDFSDANILITAKKDSPWDDEPLEILDTNHTIPRFTATVNPATNWDGFDASRVYVSPHFIQPYLWGTHALKGQQISLDLTAMVPEPATIGLAGVGAIGAAGLSMRRRVKRG